MYKLNIAAYCHKNLILLLEEYLDMNLLKLTPDMIDEYTFSKNNIDLILIEDKVEDSQNLLKKFKCLNIDVILLGYSLSGKEVRSLFKSKLIYDYLEKNNFVLLQKILRDLVISKYKSRKVLIKDSCSENCISIDNILFVSYDRENRKSIITSIDDKIYSKKNLSEIEEFLNPYNIFIRAERGIILNKNRIETIDYKEEFIIFDTKEKLFLSRKTLKSLRKNLDSWKNYIQI